MANDVCYFEFVSDDQATSGEFLKQVFSWQTFPSGPKYVVLNPGEDGIGGGVSHPEDWRDNQRTLLYIHVENIEDTLAEVTSRGGRVVVPKQPVGEEHGYSAVFATPDGLIVGVWNRD